jgi:hypothetical protein
MDFNRIYEILENGNKQIIELIKMKLYLTKKSDWPIENHIIEMLLNKKGK